MCESTDSSRTTTRSKPRCPLSISGLSCFLLPTSLCSRQREVGAAPHRGNANRPLTIQGKAKAPGTRPKSAAQAKKPQNQTNIVRQIKQRVSPPLRSKEQQAVNTVSNKPLAASEKSKSEKRSAYPDRPPRESESKRESKKPIAMTLNKK